MTGNDCYWWDGYKCWSYQDVMNYYYPQQAQEQIQQAIEVTPTGMSIEWNDVVLLASQFWWLGVIFIVGMVTLAIVGIRVLSKNKYASELFKMWGWRDVK